MRAKRQQGQALSLAEQTELLANRCDFIAAAIPSGMTVPLSAKWLMRFMAAYVRRGVFRDLSNLRDTMSQLEELVSNECQRGGR